MATYIPPEYQAELQQLQRRQQIAQSLMGQAFQGTPDNMSVPGGVVVKQNPLGYLLKALTVNKTNQTLGEGDKQYGDIQSQIAQQRQRAMQGIVANPASGLTSDDPRQQELALALWSANQKDRKPMVVPGNATVYDPDSGLPVFSNKIDPKADRTVLSDLGKLLSEQKDYEPGSREWNLIEKRIERINAPSPGMQVSFGGLTPAVDTETNQPVFVQPNNRGGPAQVVPGVRPPPKEMTPKQVPASVSALQDELLGDIGLSTGISTDLNALTKQITSGELQFGPVTNAANKFLNATGNSTQASRNAQSAMANLEKLRNDSLRLNKGTQTEGDATRAWNENFPSLNDTAAVNQRMKEIAGYNERATKEKKARLSKLRTDYNQEQIDTTPFEATTPVVGTKDTKRIRFDAQGNQLP